METRIQKLQQHLNRITSYLKPLLPIANCHMVNFLTDNRWNLLPYELTRYLDNMKLEDAINRFWNTVDFDETSDTCEISKWVQSAQSHCLKANDDYCITSEKLLEYIKSWGGDQESGIKVTQFMNSKKSYEVQTMSSYVASLHKGAKTTHCVEAGGGKGNLLVALSLGYNIPSLTVDCDVKTLANAEKRVKIIQKQWRAIAKKIHNGTESIISDINTKSDLHKFATAYISKDTDLAQVVRDQFKCDQVKLLLTGLHTCGNLGPNSLRIFATRPDIGALFNVPCCYHLLTESVDGNIFDCFQKEYGDADGSFGFPMSEYLRGFNLGRNARMLASQSIQRVAAQRQLPDISLLYRAMLQVIIKKHLSSSNPIEGKLKGIADDCQNFNEYFKMADKIMKLGLFDRYQNDLTDMTYTDCQWKKIVLFYYMRLCLAQVIESVILLDRMMFLYESGFSNAFVVKLFDPVLSPRCHSIVAVR